MSFWGHDVDESMHELEKAATASQSALIETLEARKSRIEQLDEVEAAFIDILDGNYAWYDIQVNTGLSEDRCKEIEALFPVVLKRYNQRHGTGL